MMKFFVSLMLLLSIFSCTTNQNVSSITPIKIKENVIDNNQRQLLVSKKDMAHYVKLLTDELISNISFVKPRSVIAVSSFVYLDGDYQSTPLFAKQIQESFNFEIHKVGQNIVEYKATEFLRVLPSGDFVLSKDYTELKAELPIDYFLVGTIAKMKSGIMVNAKLVGADSKAIVAASQQKIPKHIVEQYVPSLKKQPDFGEPINLISN